MNRWTIGILALLVALFFCASAYAETECGSYLDYGKAVARLGGARSKGSDGDALASRLLLRAKEPLNDLDRYGPTAVVAGPDNHYTLQFGTVEKALACMKALKADRRVIYVEQDKTVSIDAEGARGKSAVAKADPYKSWGALAMGADELAASIETAGSVTVAVVDTGVNSHPFLNSRVKTGGVDFTDATYKDGRHDADGHGTHVAGTVVDLTQGLNVNILPVRVLGDDGSGANSGVANGIRYAAGAGAKVVNLSLGDTLFSPYEDSETDMRDAIDYAVAKGVTVVVAAGNENSDTGLSSPACLRNVVCVAAIDSKYQKAYFSNYGDAVDVCAPGVNINSCSIDGGFTNMQGTSMASPHVAAIAAMVKLKYPSYTPARVENYIKGHCRDLGSEGWDRIFGYGMPCFAETGAGVEGDFRYRVKEDGAVVTGYDGTNAAVSLPETLGGLPAVGVDEGALRENTTITSLSVPGCYKEIGNAAFFGCARLTSVKLAQGAIKIGENAFEGCAALKDVSLPASLTDIGGRAFCGCAALSELILPKGIESVGTEALMKTGLVSLTVPASLQAVPQSLCEECLELERVTVEAGVNRIDPYAFYNTPKLKRLSLPASVKVIDYGGLCYAGFESIEMPGVTAIGETAFMYCPNLKQVDIPASVAEIGPSAFLGCDALESVTIPEGVSVIEIDTFAECPKLTKITVPRSVEEVGDAFEKSPHITLYGYSGSAIEEAAEKYHFPFVSLGYQIPLTALWAESSDPVEVAPGQYIVLNDLYRYEPEAPTDSQLDWVSSDPAVCGVETRIYDHAEYACLLGVAEGACTLTGTARDESGLSVRLSVVVGQPVPRAVRMDKSEATLHSGETLRLTAKILPESADQTVAWISDHPDVAMVDETGLVSAESVGTATITAVCAGDESLSAFCTVTVTAAASAEGDFSLRTTEAGDAYITGYHGSALDVDIPPTIGAKRVVGIDEVAFAKSKIISVAVSEGVTSIADKAFAGCKKLKYVTLPDSLTALAKDAFKNCPKLGSVKGLSCRIEKIGDAYAITPVFEPADTASDYKVSVSPENSAAVTIPCVVTPLTDRYFTVTLKAGGRKEVIGFLDRQPYAAAKVTINGKEKRSVKTGKTLSLRYTVKPKTAHIVATWVSEDPTVATVAQDGTVTALAPGKAIIRLDTDIGLSDSVLVIVK